jgi:hypothetical protein
MVGSLRLSSECVVVYDHKSETKMIVTVTTLSQPSRAGPEMAKDASRCLLLLKLAN